MRRIARRTWTILLVLGCIAYQYLVHSSLDSERGTPLHVALMWLPLVALACWAMMRSRHKLPWLVALCAAGALVYVLDQREPVGPAASAGISHAGAYLLLLWYFGATLVRGREPIITRFARRVHGTLSPSMEDLTRRLTVAWCAFFAAQIAVSALLYAFAPLSAWSLFVNLLNIPLLALMFAAQGIYRTLRCPDCPRASVLQAIEAFTRDASLSKGAEAR